MDVMIADENEMIALGQRLGRYLDGGEVIELVGDIGAGKTTFVKGIAQGLGIKEYVQSPSFTINRVYDARDGLRLSHYDFYRLGDAGIMSDEISEVVGDDKTITIIEWAEAVHGVLPEDRIVVEITTENNDARKMHFYSTGVESNQIIERLK